MGIEAKINNYWIAPNAVSITLNALGNENRIQGSVASGSIISCYIESVTPGDANGDGLDLDNGRNPKRWLINISPTYFNSNTIKYVYAAIPRKASFATQAVIVFPSEKIDIYGKNEDDEQIGSSDYFYIWLRGIISAPVTKNGVLQREWTQQIEWGSLGTYEDIMDMSETDWYSYSKVTETVLLLKKIVMHAGSYFQNIFLGEKELTGVATAATEDDYIDSDTLVATPNFISHHYLRKDADDEATGLIGFVKGIWIKAAGLFGFSEDGDVVARTLTASGSSGETIADIDNSTRKNLGLNVAESGIIGGILRVAKNILTKTIQSINFTSDANHMFGTGWQLTDDDGNGYSRLVVDNLFVRSKAVFNELEVRKFVAMAGNYVFSPAASIIEEVDYIDGNGNVLGYEYVKVPWVLRLIPLSLAGKFLSRKKLVRSTMSAEDWASVETFRCWIRADDGTTRTINTWQVGMLARCQTFDQSQGSGTQSGTLNGQNVTNKLYWRAVTAIGTALTKQNYSLSNHVLEDGLAHNYIDLANNSNGDDVQLYMSGSDKPEAFDHIVCYGDWLDVSLSNLISIETLGNQAPCIREMLGVGYTDGTSIDWSLDDDNVRTRISPMAGNRFVAPEFIVTTSGADKSAYDNIIGPALGFEGESGVPPVLVPAGTVILLQFSNIKQDNAIKRSSFAQSMGGGYQVVWQAYKVTLGDAYISKKNGHRYVATSTGWEDRGLHDESTLIVGLDGISARVSSLETASTNLASELLLKAGLVDIQTLVNLIETAGVHIDGINSEIRLKANKTKFLNSAGTPMITVEMCNAQGEIDNENGTIPSIVFYDGDIDNGGQARWILNYLGLIQIVNSSTAQGWDIYHLSWLGSHSVASGMSVSQIIHAEAFNGNIPYKTGNGQETDEYLEGNTMALPGTAYRYKSAYHYNTQEEKVYDPANGFYKENRFWDSDEVDQYYLPAAENNDADGYFIIKESSDSEAFAIFDGQTDPDIQGSGPSHVSPLSPISLDERVQFEQLAANYELGANNPPSGDIVQLLDHYDNYILLKLWHGYVIERYSFTVYYKTEYNLSKGKLEFVLRELDNGEYIPVSRIITPNGTSALWMDIDTIIANQETIEE